MTGRLAEACQTQQSCSSFTLEVKEARGMHRRKKASLWCVTDEGVAWIKCHYGILGQFTDVSAESKYISFG